MARPTNDYNTESICRNFSSDRLPVTNSQFARFLEAEGFRVKAAKRWYDSDDNDARIHLRAGRWQADLGFENHPVVEASWFGAVAYCQWSGKIDDRSRMGEIGARYGWAKISVGQ